MAIPSVPSLYQVIETMRSARKRSAAMYFLSALERFIGLATVENFGQRLLFQDEKILVFRGERDLTDALSQKELVGRIGQGHPDNQQYDL